MWSLEFCPGLNVLTGESGAGKSFILRALDFILGERIAADLVRPGREKALVEAVFRLDGRGALSAARAGRQDRAQPSLHQRRSGLPGASGGAASRLLMHTSQHGQQRLLSPEHHVEILDAFLADPLTLVVQSGSPRGSLQSILGAQGRGAAAHGRLQDRREFLEFQLAEIRKVDPRPGEEEELLRLREASRQAEKTRIAGG
jgi:DNA repair protein RecN (Recombination protein N)